MKLWTTQSFGADVKARACRGDIATTDARIQLAKLNSGTRSRVARWPEKHRLQPTRPAHLRAHSLNSSQ